MITVINRGGRMKIQVKIPKIKIKNLTPRQIDEAIKILVDDLKQTVPVDTGF